MTTSNGANSAVDAFHLGGDLRVNRPGFFGTVRLRHMKREPGDPEAHLKENVAAAGLNLDREDLEALSN